MLEIFTLALLQFHLLFSPPPTQPGAPVAELSSNAQLEVSLESTNDTGGGSWGDGGIAGQTPKP
ncbi:hypothetical protein [Hymenobacter sp. B81]|uniref:hypothetical protein n=1 Tax=Hymenobacter sp. B81 TaxID=3344878 RepID=UPI0037DC7FDE